jgi:hypothetical protein
MGKLINLVGMTFGYLTVTSRGETDRSGSTRWWCQCVCGKSVLVRGRALQIRKQISCGCIRNSNNRLRANTNHPRMLPSGVAAYNLLLGQYRKSASHRHLEFSLDEQTFKTLISGNCFYCGASPNSIITKRALNGNLIYNGIDRLDNTKGYIVDNCVTCCIQCNRAKHTTSKEEFLNMVERIYLRHFNDKNK